MATFSGQFRPPTARPPRDGSRYRSAVRLVYPKPDADGTIGWEYAEAWLWCWHRSWLRVRLHHQDNAHRQGMIRRWWFRKEGHDGD